MDLLTPVKKAYDFIKLFSNNYKSCLYLILEVFLFHKNLFSRKTQSIKLWIGKDGSLGEGVEIGSSWICFRAQFNNNNNLEQYRLRLCQCSFHRHVFGHCRLPLPWLRVPWCFFATWGWKIAGMAVDLNLQP